MEHGLAGVSFGYLMQDTSGRLVDARLSFDSIEDAYAHAISQLPRLSWRISQETMLAGTYREVWYVWNFGRPRQIRIVFVSAPF